MAILVRPATIQKGVPGTFTMSKAELAALPAISNTYYQNPNNWKEVHFQYKHKESNQKGLVIFKSGETTSFSTSDSSRSGNWELQKVMLKDFDGGFYLIQRSDIPELSSKDFIVVSNATHGDIFVPAGQTVTIPAGGKRQYGDFIIEAGGTLKLANGGGITEIEITQNCIINGTIDATNGVHLGGTWSSTSVLNESISHTVVQKAGGNGGAGEAVPQVVRTPTSGESYSVSGSIYAVVDGVSGGATGQAGISRWNFGGSVGTGAQGATSLTVGNTTYYRGSHRATYYGDPHYAIYKVTNDPGLGGVGGLADSGNGGGGGRSAKFVSMPGNDADDIFAGSGAGSLDKADEFGEDGADSISASQAGSGGYRGRHGQAIYLKAKKVQGSGVINASGQKGGDGGDGNEYLSEGSLYGNGSGGGGAGGDAGNVWIRHQQGTVGLTVNVSAGERGSRGAVAPDTTPAEHGTVGTPGTVSIQTY